MKIKTHIQNLGKALMMPVALLPAAVLFLRLGSPDMFGASLGQNNILWRAGMTTFKLYPLIIAISVAISFSNGSKEISALIALVTFFVISTVSNDLASSSEIAPHMGSVGGCVAGLISAKSYNKFKYTKLPDYLAFFSGERTVPFVAIGVSILFGIIFGMIWPNINQGITSVYNGLRILPKWLQTGIYVSSSRLLIPMGTHHILNAVLIFNTKHGDAFRFFTGENGAGYLMAGSYPLHMFVLPAMGAAIWYCADADNKDKIKKLMLSGAIITFLTGITEPIELTFALSLPKLYLLYVLIAGVVGGITSTLGAMHGFAFSAGFVDFIINFGIATKPLAIVLVGLIAFPVSFCIFTFAIKSMKLKTPGRLGSKVNVVFQETWPNPFKMPNPNPDEEAAGMLKALGGKQNIVSISNCATRLRIEVVDSEKVDIENCKKYGALEVVVSSSTYVQIIIGPTVQYVCENIQELL